MAQNKIRVRLKSYDSTIIDAAAAKVVDVAKRMAARLAVLFRFPLIRRS
jgi:ribosomal protein S10